MPIALRLTSPLRPLAEGKYTLCVPATTAGEALEAAVSAHPSLLPALFDRTGALRSELRVYLNNDDLRVHQGLETLVAEGDELTLIAPLAAG